MSKPLLCRVSAMSVLLAGCALLAGCGGGGEDDYKPADPNVPEVPEAAGHPEEGTHGGHLYDLGDHEFFAEPLFDAQSRKITIYLVQHNDINKPAPMDAEGATLTLEVAGAEGAEQEVELPLTAVPQPGDPEGQASQFELAGDQLPPEITSEEQLHGDLAFTSGGKTLRAHLHPPEPHEHGEGEGQDDHDHPAPAGGNR